MVPGITRFDSNKSEVIGGDVIEKASREFNNRIRDHPPGGHLENEGEKLIPSGWTSTSGAILSSSGDT